MQTRILIGVGAWLLGAIIATGGCLLAVSLLGQGFAGASAQQLNAASVKRALVIEAAEPGKLARPPARLRHPAKAPTPPPRKHRPARHTPHTPAPPASSQPPAGTVLASPAGQVVASCTGAGAYLDSWSPGQGYDVSNVIRGPAATAQVNFDSWNNGSVTMTISCHAGVPVASSSVHGGGGDE